MPELVDYVHQVLDKPLIESAEATRTGIKLQRPQAEVRAELARRRTKQGVFRSYHRNSARNSGSVRVIRNLTNPLALTLSIKKDSQKCLPLKIDIGWEQI